MLRATLARIRIAFGFTHLSDRVYISSVHRKMVEFHTFRLEVNCQDSFESL